MQCAHFRAFTGITERQNGHSLVNGSDGAGVPPTRFITDPNNFTIVTPHTETERTKRANSPGET